MSTKVHSKIRRIREHLYVLAMQYQPACYVCGEQIEADKLVTGDHSDGVLWHHIDFDRHNNDSSNLACCHRSCHRSFHRQMEEHGKDIRTKEAIEHWGKTPNIKLKSRKERVPGKHSLYKFG